MTNKKRGMRLGRELKKLLGISHPRAMCLGGRLARKYNLANIPRGKPQDFIEWLQWEVNMKGTITLPAGLKFQHSNYRMVWDGDCPREYWATTLKEDN